MRTIWINLLLCALCSPGLHAAETPAQILEHTRSVYAALTSYSDKGVVDQDSGPNSREHYTFVTRFNRSPRYFLLDYVRPGDDRIVIWGDPAGFHTWWKSIGQVSEYPSPNTSTALIIYDSQTSTVVSKIPPLLYSKAGLFGAVAHFEPSRLAGMEDVGGSKCYRLEGTTSDTYGATGNVANKEKLTVWIDSTSYLVRKTLEQPPVPPGIVDNKTTTFDPQANPKLNDEVFQFTPPK